MNGTTPPEQRSTVDPDATLIVDLPNIERAKSTGRSNASLVAPCLQGESRVESRLENETRHLLQQRLKAVTLLMTLMFSLFLIRSRFFESVFSDQYDLAEIAVLGLISIAIFRAQNCTLRHLRILELAYFALCTFLVAHNDYELIRLTVQESSSVYELAAVKSCFAHFFGLIMLYGMFIPNTWRRALAVTLPMAATPPFLLGWLRYQNHEFQAFALEVIGSDQVADHLMMMTLGIAAVSYNAYSISRLRRREFQARQVGQYHLIRSIGSGGMGEVFLAEHQLLKRPCAIKLIKPSNQMDPKAMARFEQEVQTTANLSHWNTIDVYDYGRTDDGTFYYVMEYLPGMNLSDLVEKHGPIPPGRLIHLLRQTCQALSEAHHIGLIHRDIKPANIFAAERGGHYDVAKLLDFGLVKPMASDSDMQLTQEGACVGSPLYMSPEQATIQRETDGRSDIYSLGATAYFALTGRPPFEGRNPLQLVVAHSRDPVPPPSQFAPDLPQDLEAVILKCLEKEPEKRYQSVEELDSALAACQDALGWDSQRAQAWWKEQLPGISEEIATVGLPVA